MVFSVLIFCEEELARDAPTNLISSMHLSSIAEGLLPWRNVADRKTEDTSLQSGQVFFSKIASTVPRSCAR